ncbi:MAG: GTPase HflX [Clostridia bacterium]|nr:GTPase HflX [Clostridia bacterium]
MMENVVQDLQPERAVLVGVDTGEYDMDSALRELSQLAETSGADVAATLVQKRQSPDGATYIGKGRLEELRVYCADNAIDLLIFDGELTPSQQRNIERETDVRVIDRTMLILDIFAMHARSGEGKLQVEIAQLNYSLPRLGGKGTELSRLGGGIGTRGPGETKLETDRRHIRRRIQSLETDLETLKKRRKLIRERRKKDEVITVAIVGYTNAGKSTLMNALTDAGVVAENKLFVTLDPTARQLRLPGGRSVMLVDTVGLIRRLPHHLVEAFLSTLEEAASADLILNVCDASDPECAEHLEVTRSLLDELECGGTPVISVLNKCDIAGDMDSLPVFGKSARISARTGEGLEALLLLVDQTLPPTRMRVQLLLPYSMLSDAARLRQDGEVHAESYTADGLLLDITASIRLLNAYKPYLQ